MSGMMTMQQLNDNAVDAGAVAKLASNVGDIGIAPNFSQNQLANPIQNSFPLLTWLMNTSMSTMMRNANRRGDVVIRQDNTGRWWIVLPYLAGTLPPEDTTNLCCWIPLDIAKCGDEAPLYLLCLKDCDNIMNNFVNQIRTGGSNDLTGYFLQPGETVKEAKTRMALQSMMFYTAWTAILGTTTSETALLKPFHGLLEVMEGSGVIKIAGTNVLSAMDALRCRLQVLGGSNFVLAMNPLVYYAVEAVVQPGQNGQLPAGWTRNGNDLRFNGYRIIQDKMVPVDLATNTGEIWVLDGDTTGLYLATDLAPAVGFRRNGFASTDDPTQGCASECDFYYNLGTAFNMNPNTLAVITDVPLNSACTGATMVGLDNLITPDTLVPMPMS